MSWYSKRPKLNRARMYEAWDASAPKPLQDAEKVPGHQPTQAQEKPAKPPFVWLSEDDIDSLVPFCWCDEDLWEYRSFAHRVLSMLEAKNKALFWNHISHYGTSENIL